MRVVVADDVMLTREGIVRLLEDAGVEVVGQAEDAPSLLKVVRGTQRSWTSACRPHTPTRASSRRA